MFHPCNNPVDYSFSQLALPDVCAAYGGVLGQYPPTAPSVQRIGPIPGSLARLSEGALLKVYLSQIVLSDHPLMNQEERLAAELREVYVQYILLVEQKPHEHLLYRLQSTLPRKDLIECILALHECTRLLHSLTSAVYDLWRQLVDARRVLSMTCTTVAIKVRKMAEPDMTSAHTALQAFLTDLNEQTDKREVQLVSAAINELLTSSLLPKYALQLSDTASPTPYTHLPAAELARRADISNCKYKVLLLINSFKVTVLKTRIKFPQFVLNLQKYIPVQLVSAAAVSLEVYVKPVNQYAYSQLCTVHLPLGGATYTHTQISRYQGYKFTSDLSLNNYAHQTALQKMSNLLTEGSYCRTSGTVYCAMDLDALLPHTSGSLDGYDTHALAVQPTPPNKQHYAQIYDISRENDFQVLLPHWDELDVNAPDNDYLVYLKSKKLHNNENNIFRLQGLDHSDVFLHYGGEGNFNFNVNYLQVKAPLRHKLLLMRCRKPFLFTSPVPLFDKYISNNTTLMALLSKEYPNDNIYHYATPAESAEDTVDFQDIHHKKFKISNFLQKVRNSYVILNRNIIKKAYSTGNIVLEIDYTYQFGNFREQLLYRRRALKPKVVEKEEKGLNLSHCDLLVQVVGAKNVPCRTTFSTSTAANAPAPIAPAAVIDSSPARALKVKLPVRSFVEVKFQENLMQTITLDGSHPYYKHSLTMPFLPPHNDFSPMYLEQVRDLIYFTLFDEVYEDDSERGGFLEGETTTRREKRYLGSFTIPFATLYAIGRIDGVFRIDTPLINIGYTASSGMQGVQPMAMDNNRPPSMRAPQSTIEMCFDMAQLCVTDCCPTTASATALSWLNKPFETPPPLVDSFQYRENYLRKETASDLAYYASDFRTTYVKLLLTLSPRIPSPAAPSAQLLASTVYREDREYVHYTHYYLDQLNVHGRDYKIFVTNSSGLQVHLSRYLTSSVPPEGYNSIRSLLHLVSSVPFLRDTQAFIGSIDLWCTGRQFWDMGAGDEEEHAVMLYNYMRHVLYGNNKAEVETERLFLAVGKAIPEGETVYVVLRDTPFSHVPAAKNWSIFDIFSAEANMNSYAASNYLIINPCTGHCYSAVDPYCPLKEISVLATPYNLYANIQPVASPQHMSYDVFNASSFRPYFGSKMPPPAGGLTSIQDDIPLKVTDESYAIEVERAVYQALRNSIRRWRSKRHRGTTTFHPEVSNVVQELLPQLEDWKKSGKRHCDALLSCTDGPAGDGKLSVGESVRTAESNGLDYLHAELENRMKTILRTRIFRGCPLNLPFTDVDEVVAKLRTLCIHEARHPEVQFVLAVRAFPLFNGVVSLWVFLGTLEATMPGSRYTGPPSP